MRKMKDSGVPWIGEIPEDWQLQKLKFLTRCNNEVLAENTPPSELIKYIDISSVNEKQGIFLIQDFIFSNAPSRARRVIHEGDVIISTVRTYLRAVAYIYHKYNNYICSTGFAVLSSYNDKIINRFLFYSILSDNFISTVESISTGISYPAITSEQLVNIKICLPSIIHQQQIVAYIDFKCSRIDSTIANIRTLIEKLKEYKQSVITQAVTKGLDPDAPMKDSGVPWIGEIPSNCSVIKLKYLVDIQRGKFSHRPRNDPRFYDGPYPFVQTGDITGTSKFINTFSQSLNEDGLNVSRMFTKGTILMAIAANIGDVAILNFDACFPDSIIGFITNEKIYRNFIFYSLKSMKAYLYKFATISTQLNVNIEIVRDMYIPFYDIENQRKIANYLDTKCAQIDSQIAEQETLLTKLEAYKKSLIYECVTGKREIPASFADAS